MSANNNPLIKRVFFLAVFVNVICLVSYSYAAENRSLWQKRQKNIETIVNTQQAPTKKTFQKLIDPLKIKIPEEFGTIISSHRGSNGKLIVHIQDAHANFEGQMNLANILESLIKEYELNLILVEGGSSDADFAYLRKRASPEERRKEAEKLLKNGVITGEEYLNIATDYPMSFQGIEERDVYDRHVSALWEVDKFKDVAIEYVDSLASVSDVLKPHIYNKALLELDKARKDYEDKKIDLVSYYRYMNNEAGKNNVNLEKFPNFTSLIKINEIEGKIDIEKIKDGKASAEEVELYKDYVRLSKGMDINKLFKEEPLLEDLLKESLAVNSGQKTLIRVSKALAIMKDLLHIKIVPEEYEYFIRNRSDFDPEFWASILKEKSDYYNLSLNVPSNYYVIKDNLAKVEEFYKIAKERDEIFLKKSEWRIEKDEAKLAALIAGGFHTPRLTELLADKGYSYIVVSPKVTEETDETFYRSTLRRQWLSE